MRAFMIDDERMYFKLLNQQLRNAGHILGFATSGDEGLKTIAAFDPDVIILDIRLPDMNGFDVLDRLRADPHFSHIPVIFVKSIKLIIKIPKDHWGLIMSKGAYQHKVR